MSDLTASCACGAIRMEIEGEPVAAGYCHCTRCQKRTGTAASPSVAVSHGAMRIVAGEDALSVWAPDGGFEKAFCSKCGSHLFARSPDDPGVVAIRMSAFDTPPDVRFTWRQHLASAAAWEPIPDDGTERFQRGRG